MMNSKLIAFICLALFSFGCSDNGSSNGCPPVAFQTSAQDLRADYQYWLSHGRSADFRPLDGFFLYTNIITATNGVFHCRFGAHGPGWPPGVLAITDGGQVIYICTDGKVTIEPDEYGVDP